MVKAADQCKVSTSEGTNTHPGGENWSSINAPPGCLVMKSGAVGSALSKMFESLSGTQALVKFGADWVSHSAMLYQKARCSMGLNVPPVPSCKGGVGGSMGRVRRNTDELPEEGPLE